MYKYVDKLLTSLSIFFWFQLRDCLT